MSVSLVSAPRSVVRSRDRWCPPFGLGRALQYTTRDPLDQDVRFGSPEPWGVCHRVRRGLSIQVEAAPIPLRGGCDQRKTPMEEDGGEKGIQVVVLAQREDEDREFVREFLDRMGGLQVIGVRSAAEVILQLQSGPSLILADPHIEGDLLRAVELMRRMPKLNHVSIALLSADQTGMSRYTGKGLNGYLAKPFTPEALLSRIWKVLDSAPPLPPDGSPAKLEVDVDTIEGLPTLPTVYAQVEQLCEDPHVDADELAKVIGADPSITMKLLKQQQNH